MYCCTDNWPIYRRKVIRELVEAGVYQLLFLPKYSPDLNDIEHDFSVLKRARMYSPINTSIDEIIRNYCTKNVSFLFKITIQPQSLLGNLHFVELLIFLAKLKELLLNSDSQLLPLLIWLLAFKYWLTRLSKVHIKVEQPLAQA